MIYSKDNKYYVKLTHELVEVNASLDVVGEVDLKPTKNRVELDDTFTQIKLSDIKESLVSKYKKQTTEEVEEVKDYKKQNKFNKVI